MTVRRGRALDRDVAAHAGVVETLRDLIRIPSINPPPPDRARWRDPGRPLPRGRLRDLGLEPEVIEPVAGRGSVHARLRGDGTGGDPFLLLSHLDVVPAPPSAGPTTRSRPTSPTATSTAAARST